MWVNKSNKTTCNMHFFFGHQVLILFWTHLPCFFSIRSVCMPGLFCSRAQFRRAAFWLVRIAYCGRLGARKKNHAIKWFRNRTSSNHDFISISINRTALIWYLTQNWLYILSELGAKLNFFLFEFFTFRFKLHITLKRSFNFILQYNVTHKHLIIHTILYIYWSNQRLLHCYKILFFSINAENAKNP